MKTQREKMRSGEPYLADDPELIALRQHCKVRLQQFNQALARTHAWQTVLCALIPNAEAQQLYIEPPFFCDYGENIVVGRRIFVNANCTFLDVARIYIGDNVLIGPNVQLYTATHPLDVRSRVMEGVESGQEIHIGHNVWLGGGVIVCPGVTIGDNAVVGAGSVVSKNVPANALVAGNPARIIKMIDNP
ncbi:sugar O-acetyltransferase [Pasteurellaceae bacterium TAE3-ERU1]|nr:sugar O-acetyltransferase [Pasteurellaceae bacterium TAE3-ERU1]